MVLATCHCGSVALSVETPPKDLASCNCSLCRRIGGLWGYYMSDEVNWKSERGLTTSYIQGDRLLETHSCKTCGCTTHWESTDKSEPYRMAINCRMMEPQVIADIPIRKIDGASW